ncbi:hypothetical protein [Oceanobacillus bengalensis]|uniref:Uncharacterized protein n=1 Tax=Oceanobacillus bengalensis TaxID=1435466 RepID=A0A494Z098_9BACI|nr:hypothetical protein [Oceanobacillus bengalensis]RKQ15912.1 hypothetical protein D8M05_08945 [Oceanobacillus bengalensis]
MRERTIYFLFTDTGTYLSKAINYCTKQSLNHVSIGFDQDLKEVYSFGRKHPNNPFIGGFVKEDITSEFLRKSQCAIYRCTITETEYKAIIHNIKAIEAKSSYYRYNFIGLFGVLFRVEINRKTAFFCSQFVATVLGDVKKFQFGKPTCFITPTDIRKHEELQLIYEGKLEDYQSKNSDETIDTEPSRRKSFIYFIPKKVKQFVLK